LSSCVIVYALAASSSFFVIVAAAAATAASICLVKRQQQALTVPQQEGTCWVCYDSSIQWQKKSEPKVARVQS